MTAFETQTRIYHAGPLQLCRRSLALLIASVLLGCLTVWVSANSAQFDSDGKADLVFHNKTSTTVKVWFMDGSNFRYSAPITYNGSELPAGPGWKLISTGYFDPDPANTNKLCILWQHQTQPMLAVWTLTGTNQTTFLRSFAMPQTVASGWEATATGDFDADGYTDIAFQHSGGQKAVWLMTYTNLKSSAVIGDPGPDWRITGAADFGSNSSPTTGSADGKTDLVLTEYNPVTDNIGDNLCAIWFMNGTVVDGGYAIQTSPGTNATVNPPDMRAVATASFNPSSDNKADIAFRHATIGQQVFWNLSGYQYLGSGYLKPEPDPAWKLFSQDWLQSTWRHKDVFPSISATPSANSVTLNYRIKPYVKNGITNGVTIRGRVAGSTWTNIVTGLATDPTGTGSYTYNNTLAGGARYEYEVIREGNPIGDIMINDWNYFPARVMTGINLPASSMENRGKLLVIVDSAVSPNLGSSLNTFTNDLIGDGWNVVLKTAPRHDGATNTCSNGAPMTDPVADAINMTNRVNLKNWISTNHSDAKGIVLVGHVTVPFSDVLANGVPDGHSEHAPAWVADAWYADVGTGGNWTDTNTQTCPFYYPPPTRMFSHVSNTNGDGKFDQAYAPAGLTNFVGRIDFARLPAFGTGDQPTQAEYDLLRRYFAKNHAYRTKSTRFEDRGIVFGTENMSFYKEGDSLNGKAYENAFRNLGPIYGQGSDRIVIGDPYHQKTDSYLWGFLAGKGQPDKISEGQPSGSSDPSIGLFLQHSTSDLTAGESKVGFYILAGSYFGDWYLSDDIMRATLATTNYGLASVWIAVNPEPRKGGTHWQFHATGVGDVIGSALTQTVNQAPLQSDGSVYGPEKLAMLGILGDPTLRTHVVAPVQITSGSQTGTSVTLSWTAGETDCTYYVYEAPSQAGPYSRVSGTWPTSSTTVIFTASGGSTRFMVRAAKNVTTGSATYQNLSQGTFWP